MTTQTPSIAFRAERASKLDMPKKTLWLIFFPIPFMVFFGFIGSYSGWFKPNSTVSETSPPLDLTVPNAKVKDLEKDKKYNESLSEALNSTTMSLDEANESSRILQDRPRGDGLSANDPTEIDNFQNELQRSTKSRPRQNAYLSNGERNLSSKQQKRLMVERAEKDIAFAQANNHHKLRSVYQQPTNDTFENREIAMEEKRLKQNDKLLEIMAYQARNPQGINTPSTSPPKHASLLKQPDSSHIFTIAPQTTSIVRPATKPTRNGFYGLQGKKQTATRPQKIAGAIRAVVHGDGDGITVTNGSAVSVRMIDATYIDINGESLLLPAQSLVTGQARIAGDRIDIIINTIRVANFIYQVNLMAYDLDGHQGIYVPNMAIKQQVAQAITQQGSQMANPGYIVGGNVGQQVGSQLATQGVQAAVNVGKNLLRRKVAQPKAFIKPNHQILLVSSSKQSVTPAGVGEEPIENEPY